MTIQQVMELSITEINMQMAYDITKSDDFKKKIEQDVMLTEWDNLSKAEQSKLFKLALEQGTKGNG